MKNPFKVGEWVRRVDIGGYGVECWEKVCRDNYIDPYAHLQITRVINSDPGAIWFSHSKGFPWHPPRFVKVNAFENKTLEDYL